MHIGIFNISNIKVYLDLEDNKVVCYYYKNIDQKEFLTINEVLGLLTNDLFDKSKLEFNKEELDYKIYKNIETGYFHYFKDGQEDYYKFFQHNGNSAILYSNEEDNKKNLSSKMFFNKKTKNFFVCSLYAVGILLLTSKISIEVPHLYQEAKQINQYRNYETFQDSLAFSNTLFEDDKNLLINNKLFEKISKTKIDLDRSYSLNEKLNNIHISEFTDEEKQEYEAGESNVIGYYQPLLTNEFFVYDINDEDTKVHEFLHLLAESIPYHFIEESFTEVVKDEYYQNKINNLSDSYTREQKRLKVLMEIIDPQIIWDMMFSGNIETFEEEISSLLTTEQTEEFLSSMESPLSKYTEEEAAKKMETIDNLLEVMYQNKYQESIENNEVISLIYDENNIVIENNRHYFNDAENKENRNDFFIKEYLSLNDLIEEQKLPAIVSLYIKNEISEEKFYENTIDCENPDPRTNIEYSSRTVLKDNTKWRNKVDNIYENIETEEEATIQDLTERGETDTIYYESIPLIIDVEKAEEMINKLDLPDVNSIDFSNGISIDSTRKITIDYNNATPEEDAKFKESVKLIKKDGNWQICLLSKKKIYLKPVAEEKNLLNSISNML